MAGRVRNVGQVKAIFKCARKCEICERARKESKDHTARSPANTQRAKRVACIVPLIYSEPRSWEL